MSLLTSSLIPGKLVGSALSAVILEEPGLDIPLVAPLLLVVPLPLPAPLPLVFRSLDRLLDRPRPGRRPPPRPRPRPPPPRGPPRFTLGVLGLDIVVVVDQPVNDYQRKR